MKRIILLYLMAGLAYSSVVMIKSPVFGIFLAPVTTLFWPAYLIADISQAHAAADRDPCTVARGMVTCPVSALREYCNVSNRQGMVQSRVWCCNGKACDMPPFRWGAKCPAEGGPCKDSKAYPGTGD
jgi:hypothetical protein